MAGMTNDADLELIARYAEQKIAIGKGDDDADLPDLYVLMRQARADEREACARVCDERSLLGSNILPTAIMCIDLAAAIRARGSDDGR